MMRVICQTVRQRSGKFLENSVKNLHDCDGTLRNAKFLVQRNILKLRRFGIDAKIAIDN